MSAEKSEGLQSQRASKQPKLEGLALHSLRFKFWHGIECNSLPEGASQRSSRHVSWRPFGHPETVPASIYAL